LGRTTIWGSLALLISPLLAAQQGGTAPRATFRVNVDLVQIDAVVTDAKGHPARNLEAADFQVLEDGRPQTITSFSYVEVTKGTPGAVPSAADTRTSPRKLASEDVRRVVVLMFDDAGTDSYQLVQAIDAGRKFVDTQLAPGDLASVMVSRGGMGFYEQLTNDKRQLHAAIDRIGRRRGWLVCDQPLPPMNISLPPALKAAMEAPPYHACDPPNPLGNLLRALQGLSRLPGRKAIILFTHSFPAPPALTQLANRAGVAIYVIDPTDVLKRGIVSPDAPYRKLAERTGGLFLLAAGPAASINRTMGQALEDLSGYYLLGYHRQPDSGPSEHRVVVTVKRKGFQVRTRSMSMDASTRPVRQGPQSTAEILQEVLFSPFAAGRLRLHLQPVYAASAPDAKTQKRSTILRVKLAVEGEDLRLTDAANGDKQVALDTMLAVFDEAGNPVANSGKSFTIRVAPQKAAALLERPLRFQMDLTLPKAGACQVRAAVRDPASGETGSAYEFVRLPDFNRQGMMLSSLVLFPDSAAGEFDAGTNVAFVCEVLGAKSDRAGRMNIDVQVRLRRGDAAILNGKPEPVEVESAEGHHFLKGEIHIPEGTTSGDYALEVFAYDRLGDAKRKAVSQWAGVTVR